MVKLAWLVCLVANAACLQTASFHCTSNAQCAASQPGTCEMGYCAFPDSSCASGKRFGDLADSMSDNCVGAPRPIDAGIDAPPVFVSIGGTVTGLTGTGLVLRDNNTDSLSVSASGPFTFATKLLSGTAYHVTVGTPPAGQDAYVANGSGTATSTVTSVRVSCYPAGSDPGVLCDTGLFCTANTEECCLDKVSISGTCAPSGSGCGSNKVAMECDSANECSGGTGVCCAKFKGTMGLQQVMCVSTASQCTPGGGQSIELLCDSRDATPCPSGMTCTGTSMLGGAYHTCK